MAVNEDHFMAMMSASIRARDLRIRATLNASLRLAGQGPLLLSHTIHMHLPRKAHKIAQVGQGTPN